MADKIKEEVDKTNPEDFQTYFSVKLNGLQDNGKILFNIEFNEELANKFPPTMNEYVARNIGGFMVQLTKEFVQQNSENK